MKEKIITIVKHIKWIYSIYFYVFNSMIKLWGMFLKTDKKLILFTSFGGKKYDDSPKVLYEAMKNDIRFKDYTFVWAFHKPEDFSVPGAKVIKTDTYEYFKTALKAGCWVTNSGIERGLSFKKNKTFYFNTWHGTPIKKMGSDISNENESFASKGKSSVNVMLAQGDFEADIFSRVFGIPRASFLMCGLPRNDELTKYTEQEKISLKQKLGIPANKKVILYAPTFREYERDEKHNCILKPPMELEKWERILGGEYFILFRAHYEVAKVMNIKDNSFVKNVSSYQALNDLMKVSDILISDYSSIFFDFSIMEKPMLHFTYDYEKYFSKRGMYFDIRDMLDGSSNEDDLLKKILEININESMELTKKFKDKYVNYYGNAAKISLEYIIEKIGEK